MAVQSFGTSNVLTVKEWAEGLEAEALKKTAHAKFMGTSSDSLIQVRDELSKEPGDRIRIGLRVQMDETEAPVQGNAGLEGNENTLDIYYDDIEINQLRKATRHHAIIDKQRVTYDMRKESKASLGDYFAGMLDQAFFYQIAGKNDITNTALSGNNSTSAPSTNRHIIAGGQSDDQSLTSSDTFDLSLVDAAVELAKTASPTIRPAQVSGVGEVYVMFVHPYQTTSLRGSTDWKNINQNILAGGGINDNPIITGALGVYNGVLLVENNRVPEGVDTSGTAEAEDDVRRAVLCGAQSALCAYGRLGGTEERFRWVEETFDYGNQVGIAAGLVCGWNRPVFNSEDYGTIVVSTYAVAS